MSGCVKVWDPRQKDDPVAQMQPGEGETKRDCWTVAFGSLFFMYFIYLNKLINDVNKFLFIHFASKSK